jgi:hypothetical protein
MEKPLFLIHKVNNKNQIAETMDGFVASILSASIPLLARRPPVGCRRIQDV